jgi:hypothetical protein
MGQRRYEAAKTVVHDEPVHILRVLCIGVCVALSLLSFSAYEPSLKASDLQTFRSCTAGYIFCSILYTQGCWCVTQVTLNL